MMTAVCMCNQLVDILYSEGNTYEEILRNDAGDMI